jgi:hypothetical protein
VSRATKWTLGLLAAGVSFVVLIFGHALYDAHRLLKEHLQSATAILEMIQPEMASRAAFFDPVEEGNAWDLEDKALGEIDPYAPRDPDLHTENRLCLGGNIFLMHTEESDIDQVEGQIDTFRHAFRRRVVLPRRRPGVFWEQAVSMAAARLMGSAMRLHRQGRDLEAAERLVMAIGLAQDICRHGDYQHWHDLEVIEHQSAWIAWEILSAHRLTSDQLESWAAWMDRLRSARPSIDTAIAVDSARSKRDVIKDFEDVAVYSASPCPVVPITWRDLWCSTLAKSRSVLEIDRTARTLLDQARLQGWERNHSADAYLDRASYCDPDARILDIDAASELYLLLWRVSIALAWYETENRTFPKSLIELVPRYLPQNPISPRTGKPLEYDQGKIGADPGPGFIEKLTEADDPNPNLFHWRIARKVP